MDFDEHEYLEKTADKAAEPRRKEEEDDGVNNSVAVKLGEEDWRISRHNGDDTSKNARSRDRDGHRRSSSHRQSSSHYRSSSHHRRDVETRDKNIHRSSIDRDRDRDRDSRDRDRDRVRAGRNGRERDRDRDKERDKEREKRREREVELEQERELERRSRSRSERHPHHDHNIDRERSKDREITLERKLRDKDQDTKRYKDKREVEPEADPERDQRTVFAYQICLNADERDVYEFFSKAGKVRDVRLIMDRSSRCSKGVGYIEFYDAMSVPMAIALSGQPLLGYPVMVKPSEAEKNLVQSTTIAGPDGSIGPYSEGARRLYVGNLHFNITEDQLRQVFEPFGSVELVQLPLDQDSWRCKGFGFVQFARLEDARAAQSLNGQLDIAGRTIKVSAISDKIGMQEIGVNAADFDDDDDAGLSLNAGSREIIMQKLDRSGPASSISGSMASSFLSGTDLPLATTQVLGSTPEITSLVAPVGQTTFSSSAGLLGSNLPVPTVTTSGIDAIGVPSECLLLKNMFDPNSETEPDFELDIKEDVQDECTKFGAVKHIYVEKNSSGFVYLRFDNTQSAMKAQRALHGRWFAGKMIEAIYMIPQNYESQFPDSK